MVSLRTLRLPRLSWLVVALVAVAALTMTGARPAAAQGVTPRFTLVDTPDPVRAGGLITYVATVTNPTTTNSGSFSISLPTPRNTIFQRVSTSVTPADVRCTTGSPVTCGFARLCAGCSVTMFVTVRVQQGFQGVIAAQALARFNSAPFGRVDVTASATTTVRRF